MEDEKQVEGSANESQTIQALEAELNDLRTQVMELKSSIEKNDTATWMNMVSATINQLVADVKESKNKTDNYITPEDITPISDADASDAVVFQLDSDSTVTTNKKQTLGRVPSGDQKNRLEIKGANAISNSTGGLPYINIDSSGIGTLAWAGTSGNAYKGMYVKSDGTQWILDYLRAH